MENDTSLLINNLRTRGAFVKDILIDCLKAESYNLVVQTDKWQSVQIECPRSKQIGEGFAAVVVETKTQLNEIVTVPSGFVSIGTSCRSINNPGPCSFILDRSLHSDEMKLKISVDILSLLSWATGLPLQTSGALRNWSEHVPSNLNGCETSYPYVDRLLTGLVSEINGNPPPTEMNGCLLITGDTDSATEAELINYLDTIETHGAHTTLLLRKPEQLTERLVNRIDGQHDLGIHPFSHRADLSEFVYNARELTNTINDRTGRGPVACRHHRYQWFEPNLIRSLLRELDIRCDLNLVAASGNCWLGTPTGASYLAVGGVHEAPIWLFPTIVEDEVFIYNLAYCFNYSADRRALQPTRFVLEFLDYWVLSLGLPACINLHPEHSVKGYRRLQDSILRWSSENNIPSPPISEFVSSADKILLGNRLA